MNSPDWVILGTPGDGGIGVTVYASNALTYAELRTRIAARIFVTEEAVPVLTIQKIELFADLGSYVSVEAPSYGEAMEALARLWTPNGPSSPEERLRALDPGSMS